MNEPPGSARSQLARMLALVPYLQQRDDVRLSTVAEDFGVTPEQIRRDLQSLWMCGLPGLTPDLMIDVDLEALEGDSDGVVRVSNAEYLRRPVRLGSTEAAALVVGLRALREQGEPRAHEAIDRALAKLEEAADTGATALQVELDLPHAAHPVHVATLRRAIAANQRVRLEYYVPTRDEVTVRTVDPVALLARDARDYLDAWCHVAEGRRLFRLDRVHDVVALDEPREHDDLAPRELAPGIFEPSPTDPVATVTLGRRARWVAGRHPVLSTREKGDGDLEVRLALGDPRWLIRLALQLAPSVRVEDPPSLAAELVASARATRAWYGEASDDRQAPGVE